MLVVTVPESEAAFVSAALSTFVEGLRAQRRGTAAVAPTIIDGRDLWRLTAIASGSYEVSDG